MSTPAEDHAPAHEDAAAERRAPDRLAQFAADHPAHEFRRRERREPTGFIIGHREFWELDIEVDASVLVPRPETELLVEEEVAPAREGDVRAHAHRRRVLGERRLLRLGHELRRVAVRRRRVQRKYGCSGGVNTRLLPSLATPPITSSTVPGCA